MIDLTVTHQFKVNWNCQKESYFKINQNTCWLMNHCISRRNVLFIWTNRHAPVCWSWSSCSSARLSRPSRLLSSLPATAPTAAPRTPRLAPTCRQKDGTERKVPKVPELLPSAAPAVWHALPAAPAVLTNRPTSPMTSRAWRKVPLMSSGSWKTTFYFSEFILMNRISVVG